MKHHKLIEELDQEQLNKNIPDFRVGDTLRVSIKIIEGEKERIQIFQGTVIARKGRGLSETFSMHRISYDEGMERVFYLHSPRITKMEVIKRGDVCRSKLYYLRGKSGKAAKIQEKIGGGFKKKSSKKTFVNEDVRWSEDPTMNEELNMEMEPVASAHSKEQTEIKS